MVSPRVCCEILQVCPLLLRLLLWGVVTFLFTDVEGSTRRWEADAEFWPRQTWVELTPESTFPQLRF